jgi:hypothetical protein
MNKNIFNEIKASLSTKSESPFKDVMKFETGKTYIVRLVPNVDAPARTLYHYYHHSWNSFCTGQFVTCLCPTTYGESCPIDSHVIKNFRTGSAEEKEKVKPIARKESWLVNAYVISDPTNPENEGKVKIIRYGRELAKIINSAIDGDDAEEFGVKIFDLANGCNLRIKCEARAASGLGKGGLPTYTSSKFTSPSTIEGLDAKKLDTIYSSVHQLDKFFKPKTQAELQRMLEQHFFCVQDVNTEDDNDEELITPISKPTKDEALQNIFEGIKSSSTAEPAISKTEIAEDKPATDDTDAKLKELLASL